MKSFLTRTYRLTILFLILTSAKGMAQEYLFYRSEFERTGDVVGDVDLPVEGLSDYIILEGNSANHFAINATTGVISISTPISDVINDVSMHDLVVQCGAEQAGVRVVDGYDYTLSQHPEYIVLEEHQQNHIVANNPYSGYNNLWGRGTARESVDFRMATLCHVHMPDKTIFVWDTPLSAKDYNGASVWSYINVLWGNRKGYREELSDFPFQLASIQSMFIDFEFEKLYGTEGYKIAMNHFLTDEAYLDNFSSNDGDFFLVLDQKGTWIPPYPVVLADTTMQNKPFARLYKEEDGYEWRRVIIKDNERLLKGSIDMKRLYDGFSSRGYLNVDQYIANIQIGLEITDGFGAMNMKQWRVRLNESPMAIPTQSDDTQVVFPNPSAGVFHLKHESDWQVFSLQGQHIKSGFGTCVDLSQKADGLYFLKQNDQIIKLIKQ